MFTINGQVDQVVNDSYSTPPKPILVNSPTIAHSSIHPTDSRKTVDSLRINLGNEDSPPPPQQHQTNNMDDFEIKQPIGYGSSAVVYSAIYLPHNKRVAIKVIDLDMFERNQIDELRRETSLMALSKHPHVLRVYGSFVHGSKLYIVTPFMAVGSCLDIMKISFPDGLDETSIATILKQALEGLAYLHKNGHIHRDVKAGNLLMDEDGSVLLADFGVSSSLMETGERGVRKTFVGTPCWMAPEVMEQADYDYKADIWSFGITAIELATGHAPFAKHPPLKVLMMTLNNDPPTLSRETTTNRFSKVFKEMIDSCMNKDPTKRPSADKLLAHPFFKQARKSEWLAKNLIADIPPIESRPIKRLPQRKVTTTNTDEWDFNDDTTAHHLVTNNPPKRHISFGHVVVRKPSTPSYHHASESWSPTTNDAITPVPIIPTRKTRALSDDFIIESNKTRHQHQGSAPPGFPNNEESKKGRFNLNRSRHGSLHERTPTVTFSEETNGKQHPGKLLYRTISHDDNMNRKPRFAAQQSPPPPPHSNLYTSIPLSRNNSNISNSGNNNLTRSNSTQSKGGRPESREDQYSTISSESRKIGRFELTSSQNDLRHSVVDSNFITQQQLQQQQESSPYSTHSGSSSSITRGKGSTIPIFYNQLDELLRQNDAQRQLLTDLFNMMELPKSSTPKPSQQDIIDSMEQQLQAYQRENLLLQRENDIMRKHIDELKNKS